MSTNSEDEKVSKDGDIPEVEKKIRSRYISKLLTLRKWYKKLGIPKDYSDIETSVIVNMFHTRIRTIRTTDRINQNRLYMVIGWAAVEVIGKMYNIPVSGFIKKQMKEMDRYMNLLIEMSDIDEDMEEKGSPMTEILKSSAFGVVIMIGVNLLSKKVGFDLSNILEPFISNLTDGEEDVLSKLENSEMKEGVVEEEEEEEESSGLESMATAAPDLLSGIIGSGGGGLQGILSSLGGSSGGGLQGILSSLGGSNGGGLGDLISGLGSMFSRTDSKSSRDGPVSIN